MNDRKPAARMARAAATLGASATMTMMFGLASAPAHAVATSINVKHSITVPGKVRHQIDVHLPMSQEEAAAQIWAGAHIVIKCYGDDWVDDFLPGVPRAAASPAVFRGNPGPGQPGQRAVLTATPTGVHLTTVDFHDKGGRLNEDGLPTDDDEVYCKAKWIDADGYILKGRTHTVSGSF